MVGWKLQLYPCTNSERRVVEGHWVCFRECHSTLIMMELSVLLSNTIGAGGFGIGTQTVLVVEREC